MSKLILVDQGHRAPLPNIRVIVHMAVMVVPYISLNFLWA